MRPSSLLVLRCCVVEVVGKSRLLRIAALALRVGLERCSQYLSPSNSSLFLVEIFPLLPKIPSKSDRGVVVVGLATSRTGRVGWRCG